VLSASNSVWNREMTSECTHFILFIFCLRSVSCMLELQRDPWPAQVSIWEGSRKLLGRKLRVMAGSFQRHCLSTRKGCHKRKGAYKGPQPPRNAFGKEISGPSYWIPQTASQTEWGMVNQLGSSILKKLISALLLHWKIWSWKTLSSLRFNFFQRQWELSL